MGGRGVCFPFALCGIWHTLLFDWAGWGRASQGAYTALVTFLPLLPRRVGEPELDSQRFAKLCKECGLTDRRFSNGYADVAFTLAKKNKKEQRRCVGGLVERCLALSGACWNRRESNHLHYEAEVSSCLLCLMAFCCPASLPCVLPVQAEL